jgi:hypothetical protein
MSLLERKNIVIDYDNLGIKGGGRQRINKNGFFRSRSYDGVGNLYLEYFGNKVKGQISEVLKRHNEYLTKYQLWGRRIGEDVGERRNVNEETVNKFKEKVCGGCKLRRDEQCTGVIFKCDNIGDNGRPWAVIEIKKGETKTQLDYRVDKNRKCGLEASS